MLAEEHFFVLPYFDTLDWTKFSFYITKDELPTMIDRLEAVSTEVRNDHSLFYPDSNCSHDAYPMLDIIFIFFLSFFAGVENNAETQPGGVRSLHLYPSPHASDC